MTRLTILTRNVATSIAVLALVAGCGPKASETADAPAASASNAVAESPAVAPSPTAVPIPATPSAGVMALAIKDATGADLSGDPTKGAAIFRQCQSCHVVQAGVNKVGPSLANIVGAQSGKVPGFRYSEANTNSNITWTEQELYSYLENPRAKIPGTTMAFVGIKDSQKRADLIAYLKSPG